MTWETVEKQTRPDVRVTTQPGISIDESVANRAFGDSEKVDLQVDRQSMKVRLRPLSRDTAAGYTVTQTSNRRVTVQVRAAFNHLAIDPPAEPVTVDYEESNGIVVDLSEFADGEAGTEADQ